MYIVGRNQLWGRGWEQHRPTCLIRGHREQKSKYFPLHDHGKCVPFSLHLHIDTERRLFPNKGETCLVSKYWYIVLWINVLSHWVSYLKGCLFCFAFKALCFRQTRFEICCRGLWGCGIARHKPELQQLLWNSLIEGRIKNIIYARKKGIVLFIKEIRLGCLFFIMLLELKKPQTYLN